MTTSGSSRRRFRTVTLLLGLLAAASLYPVTSASASVGVLTVGTFNGIPGQFTSVQAAVNAAQPGDWILVAPGDYHETADHTQGVQFSTPGGVVVTTSGVHIRGMARNTVVIDGTKPGSPACSANAADQDPGVSGSNGSTLGRNGILIYKATNVEVDNLTVCNFLNGSAAGGAGNQVYWDGGNTAGGFGFTGSYLTATSTYSSGHAAAGLASTGWSGGTWNQVYANNMRSAGLSISNCQQSCNQTVNHAWSESNALGLLANHAGGSLVIENSQLDGNVTGAALLNQNGACPNSGTSPITGTTSCTVFMNNNVHDNNSTTAPTAGGLPTGTGVMISGSLRDTILSSLFAHNSAWATLLVPTITSGSSCTGTHSYATWCTVDQQNNDVASNSYSANGSFGRTTNGDIGESHVASALSDCFAANTEVGGGSVRTIPATETTCGKKIAANANDNLLDQMRCDEGLKPFSINGGLLGCSFEGAKYPAPATVVMQPLPSNLPSMPNPCVGVPSNPWCSGGMPIG
jgi:hypothetical protein